MTVKEYRVPEPAPGGKLPDCAGLKFLVQTLNWVPKDIQDHYGVTQQAVSRKLAVCGLSSPPKRYPRHIPWTIGRANNQKNIYRMLLIAAREDEGEDPPEAKAATYRRFRQQLDTYDLVIGYGEYVDEDGKRQFGFYRTPRRPGVDNWIIREPDVD